MIANMRAVYCIDRLKSPHPDFLAVQGRTDFELGGTLEYRSLDVTDTDALHALIQHIADENQGLYGLLAATGDMSNSPAIDVHLSEISKTMNINYTALLMIAQAVARQMRRYDNSGSIVLVASMSGE